MIFQSQCPVVHVRVSNGNMHTFNMACPPINIQHAYAGNSGCMSALKTWTLGIPLCLFAQGPYQHVLVPTVSRWPAHCHGGLDALTTGLWSLCPEFKLRIHRLTVGGTRILFWYKEWRQPLKSGIISLNILFMASLENTERSSKLGPEFLHGNHQLVLRRHRFFLVGHLGVGSSVRYSHYPPTPNHSHPHPPPGLSITLTVFIVVLLGNHGFLGMKENRTISTSLHSPYFRAKKKRRKPTC